MKKNLIIVFSLLTILFFGCRKFEDPIITPTIDLGVQSKSTSIVSVSNSDNVVTINYDVTVGSKYSVQIVPFGQDTPLKSIGFTAQSTSETKVYNLTSIPQGNYDIELIDTNGTVIKRPISIQ